MANASWPYNTVDHSVVALRAQLDHFDHSPPEDQGEGSYQASIASLVRAARDVGVEKRLRRTRRRSPFARAA
jgi:hypothetical protein